MAGSTERTEFTEDYETFDGEDLDENNFRESMSSSELATWLKLKGIPEEYANRFNDEQQLEWLVVLDNFIDGVEFINLVEADIKEIIPPLGLAKKILRLVPKKLVDIQPVDTSSPVTCLSMESIASTPPVSATSPASPTSSICSRISSGSGILSSVDIPKHWRPETDLCIKQKCLTAEARNDIVRTLVTLTIARVGTRPNRTDCQVVARKLILSYPFMTDDFGNGYESWVNKMLERVRNLIKSDKKKHGRSSSPSNSLSVSKARKTSSVKEQLIRRYPIKSNDELPEDNSSVCKHLEAVDAEMQKKKPRDSVLLPLFKSTFPVRWHFIKNTAEDVKDILSKYPALKRPQILEQEMCLVTEKSDVKASFLREWKKYIPAILGYVNKSSKKDLKALMKDVDHSDDEMVQLHTFNCLCHILKLNSKSKEHNSLITVCEITTSIEVVCATSMITPNVAAYKEMKQYFVICEKMVICELSKFEEALFFMFASYYVFHLQYPALFKQVLFFLQDYVFCHPDSVGRPSSYMAISTDIKRNL